MNQSPCKHCEYRHRNKTKDPVCSDCTRKYDYADQFGAGRSATTVPDDIHFNVLHNRQECRVCLQLKPDTEYGDNPNVCQACHDMFGPTKKEVIMPEQLMCKDCGQTKAVSEFYRANSSRGYEPYCKACKKLRRNGNRLWPGTEPTKPAMKTPAKAARRLTITMDLTRHQKLYKQIKTDAGRAFRTTGQQAAFMLHKSVTGGEYDHTA